MLGTFGAGAALESVPASETKELETGVEAVAGREATLEGEANLVSPACGLAGGGVVCWSLAVSETVDRLCFGVGVGFGPLAEPDLGAGRVYTMQ